MTHRAWLAFGLILAVSVGTPASAQDTNPGFIEVAFRHVAASLPGPVAIDTTATEMTSERPARGDRLDIAKRLGLPAVSVRSLRRCEDRNNCRLEGFESALTCSSFEINRDGVAVVNLEVLVEYFVELRSKSEYRLGSHGVEIRLAPDEAGNWVVIGERRTWAR